MKVLKSSLQKKYTCEFGDYELVPDEGWKISQSFIDYESGLLYVSTNDTDESNWGDAGYGTRTIPVKNYLLDPKTGDILSRKQWSAYFSYEPQITYSEDGKYKMITTRVHNEERGTDSIHEELIDLENNKKISSAKSISFFKEKRETALDQRYREIREREERKAQLDAMPTLTEFFELKMQDLRAGDLILEFCDQLQYFRLTYTGSRFELSKVRVRNRSSIDWETIRYKKIKVFETIEDFATMYLNSKSWYLKHSVVYRNQNDFNKLLKKFIVHYFNVLRLTHDFTHQEYGKIQQWENFFYERDSVKPSEYKQFCPHCKAPVLYYPRYPKSICRNCSAKTITDEHGVTLSFSNLGMSGGLKIQYKKEGKIIHEDDTQFEKRCFIDGKPFIATEAYFGGIVIQAAD